MNFFRKMAGLFWRYAVCAAIAYAAGTSGASAQQIIPPPSAPQVTVRLEARLQRREGDLFFADGKVEIEYRNLVMRADHAQYNAKTYLVTASGNVTLDVETQHLTADSAEFNMRSGEGRFTHVRGTVMAEHRPNATILVSPNPLTFHADEVRRLDARTYTIEHAWLTVCEPDKPSWQFFTTHATLYVDRKVAMLNANFRFFRVPLMYMPYASAPAGRNLRQSGLLMPEFADTTVKGVVLGDGYYWAPKSWADISLGGAYYSLRGWQENGEIRAKPWENVTVSAKYFGVIDRGISTAVVNSSGSTVNEIVKQGGHNAQLQFTALLKDGWRGVANLNQLTSETYQLVFAPTFGEAVNSEVRSSAFLTNNFDGYSVNFAANAYKNFLNAEPQVTVDLSTAPEARFASIDRAPWKNLPFYFGIDAFAGADHRSDDSLSANGQSVIPGIDTATFVERSEIAPRVVLPLRWGPWLGVTTSYTVRTSFYGAQMNDDSVVATPLRRTTNELNIDLRPPALERVWNTSSGKWKHTIEPEIEYNYVNGVNQFDRFILFDEDETLTDTNDFRYSITQRLFHRARDGQADEILRWKVAQAYYFDPTFGGALVPGTRNVFQALDAITPFAFADQARHFSPIDSDLVVSPGGIYDAEVRLDFDTVRHKVTTAGTLLKLHPAQNFNFTVAHFSIDNSAVLQPVANQIRAQAGYGAANRRGWNAEAGFSYDFEQGVLQNQFVQVSYNGSCCGLSVEYRRLSLGAIRTENQFRVALNIANIGTFGNLRREEKIF